MPVPGSGQQDDRNAAHGDAGDASLSAEPWLARKDWASGVMRDNAGPHLGVYVIGILGIAFLALSYGFVHEFPRLAQGGGYGPFIPPIVCGLLGAGLTVRAIHLILRWLKYGGAQLRLEAVPIPLGGALRAELIMSNRIRAGRLVRVRLQSMSAVVKQWIPLSGALPSAEDRSTEYNVVWQDEDTLQADGSGKFKVEFAVPADGSSTTLPNGRDWRFWQLVAEEVRGRTTGYHAEFELPVFHTSLAAGEAAAVASIIEARQHRLEDYKPGPGLKVEIRPAAEGGTEFLFPPVRARGGAISQSIVFLLSFSLMVASYGFLPLAVTVIWGVPNILLYFWLARLWFVPERVVIGNGAIRATSGLFRLTQTMAIDQVKAIHAVPIELPWLVSIRIKGEGWHQIGTGQGIRDSRDAEWLALQMSRAAGVQPASPIPGNEGAEEVEMVMAYVKDMTAGGEDFGLSADKAVEAIGRAHSNGKSE